MNIVEMIMKLPEDKVGIQALQPAITNATKKKNYTSLTFDTEVITPSDVINNTGRIGIIVWMDRNEFERLRKK